MSRGGWPSGGGEMASRIRNHDWAVTPLGPIETWPQSLKTIVDLMLGSEVIMVAPWGDHGLLLYNDAYSRLIGPRDATALGCPAFEVLPELRSALEPQFAAVMAGETVQATDQFYPFVRATVLEDAWFDVSHSPIRGENGQVVGILTILTETTSRVAAEGARYEIAAALQESKERQCFLLKLSDALRPLGDPVEIQGVAARLLGERLGASRAYYVEYDSEQRVATVARDFVVDGVQSVVGRYAYDNYRTTLERISDGTTWIVEDVTANQELSREEREKLAALSVVSWINVPLIKQGALVAILCVVQDTTRKWSEAEMKLVEDAADRIWPAVERARAEAALAASEVRYRSLFETMDEGFAVVQVLRDEAGAPADFRYLTVNPAVERLTGLRAADVLNHCVTELIPEAEAAFWIEVFGGVAASGVSTVVEHAGLPGRWFRAHLTSQGEDRVAALYDDITERKRAEAALRESEERQAFLLKLSDTLQPLANAIEIQDEATRLLGEELGASRVLYMELGSDENHLTIHRDFARGRVPAVRGAHRLSDFGASTASTLRKGDVLAVADVHAAMGLETTHRSAFDAIEVRAHLEIPLVKKDRLVAVLGVHQTEPREWTRAEISLVEEAAERTWAAVERAQAEAALREAQTLRRIALEGGGVGAWRWDIRSQLIWGDPRFWAIWGIPPTDGSHPLSVFTERMSPDSAAQIETIVGSAIEAGHEFDGQLEIVSGPTAGHWVRWRGRVDRDDPTTLYGVTFDVTEQKRADSALREGEERHAFLLKLSDALRPLRDPLAIQEAACRVLGEHLGANRVLYAETAEGMGAPVLVRATDYTAGVPSRVGWHRLDDYGKFVTETWRSGLNLLWSSLDDLPHLPAGERAAYEAVEIEAIIGVPLVKEGRFEAFLAVHQATPRDWTANEIALTEETVERTWAAVERAKAEAALRESEERYLGLYNAIDQGFCTIKVAFDAHENPTDYQFVEVSPSFEAQTGIKDAAGRWMREIAPDHDQHWFDIYGRVALTGEPARFENFSTPLDRWWSVYAFLIGDPTERTIAVLFSDITNRKKGEEALHQVQEFNQRIIDGTQDCLKVLDLEGRLLWISPRGQKALEITNLDDVIGTLWTRFFRGEARTAAEEAVHTAARGGTGRFSGWALTRSGKQKWWDCLVSPMFGPNGKPEKLLALSRDMTSQWRAGEALRESEERFRLVVENARGYAIFTTDAERRIVDWYEGAETIFGYSSGEIRGKSADILFVPEDREKNAPQDETRIAREEGVAPNVRWHLRKDCARVFIEGRVIALRDGDGSTAGYLKIGQDVTARRQAEAALRESEARFRQFSDASSDVLWTRDAETLQWDYLSPAFEGIYGVNRDAVLGGDDAQTGRI